MAKAKDLELGIAELHVEEKQKANARRNRKLQDRSKATGELKTVSRTHRGLIDDDDEGLDLRRVRKLRDLT